MYNEGIQNPINLNLCLCIEDFHNHIRSLLEDIVKATAARTDIEVLASLCLKTIRFAMACSSTAKSGLAEESIVLYRSCIESAFNMMYISHSGPRYIKSSTRNSKKNAKTASECEKEKIRLAEQFKAFGDKSFGKMLVEMRDRALETFEKCFGSNQKALEFYYGELLKRDQAHAKYPELGRNSWISLQTAQLIDRVKNDPPPYANVDEIEGFALTMHLANGAVHADALSMRIHAKEFQIKPLQIIRSSDSTYPAGCLVLSMYAWFCLAEAVGKLEEVQKYLEIAVADAEATAKEVSNPN